MASIQLMPSKLQRVGWVLILLGLSSIVAGVAIVWWASGLVFLAPATLLLGEGLVIVGSWAVWPGPVARSTQFWMRWFAPPLVATGSAAAGAILGVVATVYFAEGLPPRLVRVASVLWWASLVMVLLISATSMMIQRVEEQAQQRERAALKQRLDDLHAELRELREQLSDRSRRAWWRRRT